ncbi:DEAD/DEAH box helicase [Corynebacterium anserum]|uniref:DEAD/DEAH box helicase n=1 Tax=Corynebacterium anserum TaxID=2684406 RepID=UPI001FE78B93|nr:SNF2-related protein [Corynebacterium anserum]
MSIDPAYLEHLISDVRSAVQHKEATQWRLDTVSAGGTAPTIGSDDDARVFAFPATADTAAYVAQFRNIDFSSLRNDLANIDLPVINQFDALADEARQTTSYRGLRKLFSSRPIEGERALAWMQSVDVSSIHTILSGIDAALGSTDHNEFIGLHIGSLKGQIEADLVRLTGWPIEWISADTINQHNQAVSSIQAARATEHALEAEVQRASRALCEKQAHEELVRTDISVLDHITDGRVRLGPLKHLTLPQIAAASPSELMTYDGVGEKTANQAIAAARSYSQDVINSQIPQINYQDKLPCTPYVTALANLLTYRDNLRDLPLNPLILAPVDPGTPVAIAGVNDLITSGTFQRPHRRIDSEEAWSLYAVRAAEFHAYGDSGAGTEVPEDIAEHIADITLRGTLHASLRGYQAFGAKFVLAQKKALIGDEMGLGKTMQALAVLAHLKEERKKHALVVCPPSLRINWQREITKFTDLPTYLIHGPNKDVALEAWKHNAGVAIAGFPETRANRLLEPAHIPQVDIVVVDEAHRAKNPHSQQSQGVKALTEAAEYAVYLTGTPLENRVSEFEVLLGYLDPAMNEKLDNVRGQSSGFKKAIAGIYLRRNQQDVLDELPPVVEIEEWVEPKPGDVDKYEDSVRRAHFMDMRQAFSGKESAKMERVLEILGDGAEAGKTIIFTYFRSVLDTLMMVLHDRAYGPIAGGVNHEERQKAVDAFSSAEAGAVLVCQITAASEGLNIQAANRVILIEPQLNPAVEAQAIARAHRMGQINTVEVHRLLTPNSVEERLVDMLANKRAVFDRFARDSVTADSNPEALDVSEAQLIHQVIKAERERLGETPRL